MLYLAKSRAWVLGSILVVVALTLGAPQASAGMFGGGGGLAPVPHPVADERAAAPLDRLALPGALVHPPHAHQPLNPFPTDVDLSSGTAAGQASGGPAQAPDDNPVVVDDSAGDVYVAWAANDTSTGHWRVYFSYSSDGSSFSSPVALAPAPGTNVNDVSPSLAVTGSGSSAKVAVAFETMTGYIGYGGYELDVSTDGGSSFTTEGSQAKAGDTDIYTPSVAWADDGNLLVSYWGYYSEADCSSDYGNVIEVDTYTSGTTYDTSGYVCGLLGTDSSYAGLDDIACSTSTADCTFLWVASNSGGTEYEIYTEVSPNSFATSATAGATLATETWASGDYITVAIDSNDLIYTGGATGLAAYIYNSATPPTYTYVGGYASTTADWSKASTTTYTAPSGSTSLDGIAVGSDGSNVMLAWTNAATDTVQTAWASSAGGTFITTQDLAPGGSLGEEPGLTGTTSVAPWRGDFVWINASSNSGDAFYTHFIGLGSSATVAPSDVDLGTAVTFTGAGSNGAPAYTLAWSFGGSCSNSCSTTTSPTSVTYAAAGTYAPSLTVTDSIGETSTVATTPASVTVNCDPTVSVTPASSTVDVNQAVSFTAKAACGSGTYSSYAWYVNGAAQSGQTTSTFSYTFAAQGSDTVAATVTDSLGITSAQGTASVTVNAALTVGPITFAPAHGLPNSPMTASATVTGGTPGYTYAWSTGAQAKQTTTTASFTFATAGNYSVYLNVTDSASPAQTAGAVGYALVDPAMTVTASAAPASIQAGKSSALSGSVSGGTAPYTYTWVWGDGSGSSSGTGTPTTAASHVYGSPGVYTAVLYYNDSFGQTATGSTTITVYPPLVITSTSDLPNPTNTTTSAAFTAQASGGVGLPYTWNWDFGDGSTAATTQNATHLYTKIGNYTVNVTVKDPAGDLAYKTFVHQVDASKVGGSVTLSALTISPATGIVSKTNFGFSATVAAGTAPYSFTWDFGDGTSTTTTLTTAGLATTTHTYSKTGNFDPSVTVTDAAKDQASSSSSLTVTPPGKLNAFASAPTPVDAGLSFLATGSASAGSGTYEKIIFDFGDGTANSTVDPAAGADEASVSHIYAKVGSYSLVVAVIDSNGTEASSTPLDITVDPALEVNLTLSASDVDANNPVTFKAAATGGASPYIDYEWRFDSASTAFNVTQDTQTYQYATPGTYTASVSVEDSNNVWNTAYATVTVNPAITVVVVADKDSGSGPFWVNFTATATGGSGTGYTYCFFGSSNCWSNGTDRHRFTTEGSTVVPVIAKDSLGGSGQSNVTIVVSPPKQGQGSSQSGGFPWWILLVILLAVAALIALVILVRRRRKPEVPEDDAAAAAAFGGGMGAEASLAGDGSSALPSGGEGADAAGYAAAGAPEAAPGGEMGGDYGGGPIGADSTPIPGFDATEGLEFAAAGAALGAGVAMAGSPGAEAPEGAVPAAEAQPSMLTQCPQCNGELAPDGSCHTCQVRWEAQPTPEGDAGMDLAAGAAMAGLAAGVAGSGAEAPPPVEEGPSALTACPQCGGPLEDGRVCHACQVSWEAAPSPPPSATEGAADLPPPEVSTPEAPPVDDDVTPVVSPDVISSEEPAPPEPAPSSEIPAAPASAPPAAVAPAPEPAATPVPAVAAPAPAAPSAPKESTCFICGGPLEAGYCPVCRMRWGEEANG